MEEYYKLTDEDKIIITECFNDRNLEELLDFIDNGTNVVAGIHVIHYLRNLAKKHGPHFLLNSCENCAKSTTICDATFALETCGEIFLEWEEK